MKNRVLAAVVTAMLLMTACGKETGSSDVESVHPETPSPSPIVETVAVEPSSEDSEGLKVITDREVVDGRMQSYLTGEWKDAEVVERRPFAIMVPNNPPAMPQSGISKASIIYEAPVEGRITRLLCVVEDYDDLVYIGPIRSSRDYFVYEAMALDAVYCHWGLAVPYVADLINSNRVDNISQAVEGVSNPYPSAFSRRVDRKSAGYATEFTAYMWIGGTAAGSSGDAPESAVKGYTAGIESKRYAKTYEESGRFAQAGRDPQAFLFVDEGIRAEYEDYPDAFEIYPGGTGSNKGGYGQNNACFTYNEEDHLYYRSQYGDKQLDELTGEQLAVSNVVFKVCHGEVRDSHDYLAFGCHGTGDAYVFTNGKMIKATWEHAGDYMPNVLYDENGEEIVLNQGKTWICNIWKEYAEFAEVDGKPLF